ncbi:hypothetical protein LCI18_013762 [Fusarium solani-melongenae]|uniref:Uncharacterized protein n=1 Tax=Fusarium solani subsp. cucurbitae TaxID=2747967 RepID=A0ACD3ZNR2_FUSSC|nr:hypothetical protein LCI18_013762 [Fusarium solani-melongenae]
MLSSTAMAVTIIYQVTKGLGLHMQQVDQSDWVSLRFAGWLGMLFNAMSLYLTKISILLLYARILTRSKYRMAIYVVSIIVGVSFVYTMVITFLACRPLHGFWNPAIQTCLTSEYWIVSTAMHLGTDLLATILPFPLVLTLNMRVTERAILLLLFALGFLVSITSLLRLYYSVTRASADSTWASILPTYWGCIEINVAIICACLMTLRPLAHRWFPRLLLSKLSSRLQNSRYPSARSAGVEVAESLPDRRSESSWGRMDSGDSVDDLILQGSSQDAVKMSPLAKVYTNTRHSQEGRVG